MELALAQLRSCETDMKLSSVLCNGGRCRDGLSQPFSSSANDETLEPMTSLSSELTGCGGVHVCAHCQLVNQTD
jgi:hypothetical protein